MSNYNYNVPNIHKTTKGSLTWYTRIYILQPVSTLERDSWLKKYHWFPVTEPPVTVNDETEHVVSKQFINKCHPVVPQVLQKDSRSYLQIVKNKSVK